jgi:hypothetical protein
MSKKKLSNQIEAIRHFIEKMDIEMVDTFLDDDKTYAEHEKYWFISRLQIAFESFAALGDTHLVSINGRCDRCDKTKTGYTFIGNNSKNYMSIVFDTENLKINDLYECRSFVNNQKNRRLNGRIYIDQNLSISA